MGSPPENDSDSGWFHDLLEGVTYYYLSGLVLLLGVSFGSDVVWKPPNPSSERPDLEISCSRFDGLHYEEIVDKGYLYDPSTKSNVAFFPAYPLSARAFRYIFDCETKVGLLVVSNLALLGSFVLLARYLRMRPIRGGGLRGWVLLAFAVWPTTFFFRMAYAESLFVFCSLLALYGIARRWALFPLALVTGLACATRPVGVAVSAAFIWHVVQQPGSWLSRCGRVLLLGPVACWGLLAYMAYQYDSFGTPLAFSHTQDYWTHYAPVRHPEPAEKLWALVTLEPVRGVYDPESKRYWARSGGPNYLLFNLAYWNPLLFGLAVFLVALGAARRWLSGPEVVLSAAALAIPYFTRGYEMSMASHGRFAAAVLPVYLVAGRLLACLPPPMAGAVTGVSTAVLACWTALFAAGHIFF